MNFRDIEYFIAIVDAKTFSAAAENLFISQPALSQHIRKLEDELGMPLFDRSKRTVELTETGALFLQEGRQMLQSYRRMQKRIAKLKYPPSETVHFGISPFYSRHYLPLLLPPLISAHPSLKYEVMEDYSYNIERALLDGKLDFCLVPLLPQNPELTYEAVYQETILLAIPKDSDINDLAIPTNTGLPYMDLRNVRNEPFVALRSVQKFTEFTNRIFEQAGFTPNIVCETMNWDALNMMVSSGLGVGFVPNLVIHQLDASIRPRYYRLLPDAQRTYTIAYRRGDSPSGPAQLVLDVFREAFRRYVIAGGSA